MFGGFTFFVVIFGHVLMPVVGGVAVCFVVRIFLGSSLAPFPKGVFGFCLESLTWLRTNAGGVF